MHSYIHTSSTGEQTEVFLGDGLDRWVAVPGHPGRKMMLPYLPNTTHGRYFHAQLAAEPSPRRAYRKLHDEFLLARPLGVIQFDARHRARRAANFRTCGDRLAARLGV